jgi:hypothetical protein
VLCSSPSPRPMLPSASEEASYGYVRRQGSARGYRLHVLGATTIIELFAERFSG